MQAAAHIKPRLSFLHFHPPLRHTYRQQARFLSFKPKYNHPVTRNFHISSTLRMSAEDIITAYDVAVPKKQEQNLPGLDKKMTPHLEYTKQEYWDDNGKPRLVEYQGSGKYVDGRVLNPWRITAYMFVSQTQRQDRHYYGRGQRHRSFSRHFVCS